MHLDLSTPDAMFLKVHLTRHLEMLENELVHTDKREMQRSLADDAKRLRTLLDQMIVS